MKTVFVAGHRGMVGAAIVKQLEKRENVTVITRTRAELDLTSQQAVSTFFADLRNQADSAKIVVVCGDILWCMPQRALGFSIAKFL